MENRETLEDFIAEAIRSDDYYDLLSNRLDSMPRTRAAAEEILSGIISYDEPSLYVTLLRDYDHFLTEEEIAIIRHKYNTLFDAPLEIYGIE